MIGLLAPLFFLTALIYSTSGFGGGSTYISLLGATQVDPKVLPIVALLCNLLVVTRGAVAYGRAGLIPVEAWHLTLLSVPLAFVGGLIELSESWFFLILGCSLTLAGALTFWIPHQRRSGLPTGRGLALAVGAGSGFLAGLVGIGGGVFLAPLLYARGHWRPKVIAATTSVFILCNSVAGLTGQLASSERPRADEVLSFLPLFVAVLIGGHVGSRLSTHLFSHERVRQVTGLLILIVGLRLIFQFLRRTIGA